MSDFSPQKARCPSCNELSEVETLRKFSNGLVNVEGRCGNCDKWLRWTPYRDSRIVRKLLDEAFVRNPNMRIA